MVAALAALAVANSPLAPDYAAALAAKIGPLSVIRWINDGLMALFFLLVGCEIKRELVDGELANPADRRLPVIAAACGMVVPALVYLLIARDAALARGRALPRAGGRGLGKRVPASLKLFLTTVASVDDMGAVAIIAVAYSHGLDPAALLWFLVLISGVHATVAGVLAVAFIPVTRSPGTPDAVSSPLHRLEHALNPWVAFGIVPLFGFANAGVARARARQTPPRVAALTPRRLGGPPGCSSASRPAS